MEFDPEKKQKELAWAREHDQKGICSLINSKTDEVVYESYRPSIQKLNQEITAFFKRNDKLSS